ncbi:MAG TPA: ABC transporter ATP-binding protein [Cryptosporangiaceae bacterium]|nr:ABC transporter ATP-binding protein [Cryptosporangiaceae bacterium]
MSELVVRGLDKGFGGPPVLSGLDLTVPRGALAAVLGPSGCGKTTLLRVVAGFEAADRGEVVIDGRLVAGPGVHVPPERRRVGVVPQEGALFPHLSVAGNVGFGLRRGPGRAGRVAEMLELVGLAGFGDRMPHELSGGQQQRVALARALAGEPALVLLDEPFNALDTGLRNAVRADIRAALRAAGTTAVLVTHDQQEALSMADLVAVMRDGRVVQVAVPADLYTAPHDVGVATFVGDAAVLDATADQGTARCVLGPLPLRASDEAVTGPGTVVIRPEQIVIGPAGAGVPARVTGSVFYGHDAMVRLSVPAADAVAAPVELIARTSGPHGLEEQAEVGLRVVGTVSFFPA